jgi:hypothetical protein
MKKIGERCRTITLVLIVRQKNIHSSVSREEKKIHFSEEYILFSINITLFSDEESIDVCKRPTVTQKTN